MSKKQIFGAFTIWQGLCFQAACVIWVWWGSQNWREVSVKRDDQSWDGSLCVVGSMMERMLSCTLGLINSFLWLTLKRWANICKAWVLTWGFWAERGYTERQKLFQGTMSNSVCAVEGWVPPPPTALFLAFPGLAANWSQVDRGGLWECNSSWQKIKHF